AELAREGARTSPARRRDVRREDARPSIRRANLKGFRRGVQICVLRARGAHGIFALPVILTRTAFLRLFGMAAVGLRIEPAIAVSAFRPEEALAAHFHPLVGDDFRVTTDSSRLTMRLAKVRERPLTKNVAQFSLTFHGPA